MKYLPLVVSKSITSILAMMLSSLMISQASALTMMHTVDATDNLYYSDWGHWFTASSDGALAATGSTAASAVANSGSIYNFASWDYLDIAVSGSVIDAGIYATGADGCPSSSDPCWFNDGQFRLQDVYSVIGLWSSSADTITPILSANVYMDWRDAVFLVGSSSRIFVPGMPQAYLFLAENDGDFADNSGFYTATITASRASVPEPASALLLLTSLLGLFAIRRKR